MGEGPSRRLEKFLIDISHDPLKRQRLETDPDSVAAGAGLTADEIELLKKQDPDLIRAQYGRTNIAHMTTIPMKTKKPAKKVAKKKVVKKKAVKKGAAKKK